MTIGKLQERVLLKALVSTPNGKGGFVETWPSTTATVWAEVLQESGSERFQGSQQEHARRYRIRIRYLSTVAPTMRVTYDARTLKIVGITYDPRKRWHFLDCEEDPSV